MRPTAGSASRQRQQGYFRQRGAEPSNLKAGSGLAKHDDTEKNGDEVDIRNVTTDDAGRYLREKIKGRSHTGGDTDIESSQGGNSGGERQAVDGDECWCSSDQAAGANQDVELKGSKPAADRNLDERCVAGE